MASDREKILQAAQKYVDKKKYDRAVLEYQKLVQQDPNDARTLLKIGDLQSRMKAYAEAIATYDAVGQYYSAQGFALKAIAVYKQIRELIGKYAPHLADRYGHIVPRLAEIYTQLGLTSDALAAYDEVAARLQRAGRDRDAIDVFRRMVELDATNPLPHLRLAEACCRVQSLDDAIESFSAAAELLMRLNRRDDAIKVLDRILHFKQDPKFAKLSAQLYLGSGQHQDGLHALAKLQISFQADPRDLETLSLLGQAFNAIGQGDKAVEVYKEMARLARDQGEPDLYQQVIDHLLSVAPNDPQVRALVAGGAQPRAQSQADVSEPGEVVDVEDFESVPGPRVYDFSEGTTSPRAPQFSAPDVVVVDEGLEAAEEFGEVADSFDAIAHARKAVIDAESFRKLRLFSKAIETLRIALEIDPRSAAIREKLRDIFSESGDGDAAVGESITIAAIMIDQGRNDSAEVELYRVLEVEPEHPTALQMLQDLGVVVPASHADYEPMDSFVAPEPSPGHSPLDYDPGAPLPSYDLEEIGAAQAMGSGEHGAVRVPQQFDAVDDPFGEALPSFPLGQSSDASFANLDDEVAEDLDGPLASVAGVAESFGAFDEDLEEVSLTDLEPVVAGPLTEGGSLDVSAIEEVLEEADFFVSQGLQGDARMILEDQLTRTPGHPLVLEKLTEIQQAMGGFSEAGAREVRAASERPPSDRAFDIAASLGALDDFEAPGPASVPSKRPAFASAADEVDVDQVFAKFKEGVRAQVADSDSSTHYDLGVAYKEMGLLPDAIGEFQIAARDPVRECMCWAMVGMIHLEQEELEKAADAFIRGLHAEKKTVDQEMSLYYDLGTVYEMQSNADEALYYFQKIARRDPGYRDVKDRIAALQPSHSEQPKSASKAIGNDDEFDRVFDELFDSK